MRCHSIGSGEAASQSVPSRVPRKTPKAPKAPAEIVRVRACQGTALSLSSASGEAGSMSSALQTAANCGRSSMGVLGASL